MIDCPVPNDRRGFVMFQAPAILLEAVTVEVSLNGGTTFAPLHSSGAAITLPVGAVTPVMVGGGDKLRLTAGGNVAADRTFFVNGGG